jgi:hypothetical protein
MSGRERNEARTGFEREQQKGGEPSVGVQETGSIAFAREKEETCWKAAALWGWETLYQCSIGLRSEKWVLLKLNSTSTSESVGLRLNGRRTGWEEPSLSGAIRSPHQKAFQGKCQSYKGQMKRVFVSATKSVETEIVSR